MNDPTSKVSNPPSSEVRLGDDGVVRVTSTATGTHELAEAEAVLRAVTALSPGRRSPVLVDIRNTVPPSQAARAHYMGPEARRVCAALGLLVGSPFSQVIGNFMIKLARGAVPTRLFTTEEEALAWLKGYVE